MIVKKFNLFRESVENDLDIIESVFIEIKDLKGETFKIKNATHKSYEKVHSFDIKVTSNNNYKVDILCDYLYQYAIEGEIRVDIRERLRRYGYKIKSVTNVKTNEYTVKDIPTHGRFNADGTQKTTTVSDPKYLISVLIKNIGK